MILVDLGHGRPKSTGIMKHHISADSQALLAADRYG